MHRYAVSLNTMAQIKNELNRSDEALIDVLQARRTFEEVKSRRNLALNAKAEGDVRRWLAYRNRMDWQASQREYAQAIARYQYALELFDSPEMGERLRRIEVRQALGCAYRSRGKVLFEAGRDCSADMALAQHYLQQALDIAQQQAGTPIISDLLEDIAVIYVNQDKSSEAITWLQQSGRIYPRKLPDRRRRRLAENRGNAGAIGLLAAARPDRISVCTEFARRRASWPKDAGCSCVHLPTSMPFRHRHPN